MDTLAHGLVTYAVRQSTRSRVSWRWLVFFGMFPDFVWFPFTFANLVTSGKLYFFNGPYNVSHSFVIWFAFSALCTIKWRRTFLYTWPWALHILVDMPGHLDMHTPLFWPISDWKFNGLFDWLTAPWFAVTYGGLAIVFFWLWRVGRLWDKKTTL